MELTGGRFGRLTAVRKATNGKRTAWYCVCDCGAKVVKAQGDLRSGDTRSCGCARRDANIRRNTRHGLTNTPTYKKWQGMWKRVRSPNGSGNACYAGITVCKRWAKFENFLADMGEVPDGYSLDRINNSKGYSRANCRWVPLAEQARNTQRLRFFRGLHISEAARRAGLEPDVVFDRINKLGWDVKRALITPKRNINRRR